MAVVVKAESGRSTIVEMGEREAMAAKSESYRMPVGWWHCGDLCTVAGSVARTRLLGK